VISAVINAEIQFTWWLSTTFNPEICLVFAEGFETTFFCIESHPEYCKVAPSRESNIEPIIPANVPTKIKIHCGGQDVVPVPYPANNNPQI